MWKVLGTRWSQAIALVGLTLTSMPLAVPMARAQGALVSQDAVYDVARGITGEQSPLFLFSGFDVFSTSVLVDEDKAVVAFESLTIPDGPNLGNSIIFELHPVGFGLLEIPQATLPKVWDAGNGQTLTMQGPAGEGPRFRGLWDQNTQGFYSFDLDLGDIRYQGEGIGYHVAGVRFALANSDGVVSLGFQAERWEADYTGSLDGTEQAHDLQLELSVPADRIHPSELLTLANRLMAFALDIEKADTASLFQAPVAEDLSGMSMRLSLEDAVWDTSAPPAKGGVRGVLVEVNVEEDGEATSSFSMRMAADGFDFGLADNAATSDSPTGIEIQMDGLDRRALALSLYGLGFDDPTAGDPLVALGGTSAPLASEDLAAKIRFQIGDFGVLMPPLEVDGTAQALSGQLTLSGADSPSSSSTGENSLRVQASARAVELPDFIGREDLEPFASEFLIPMLPEQLDVDVIVSGLEAQAVAQAVNALAQFDIDGLMAALPSDLEALSFKIQDTKLKNALIDLDVQGQFDLSGDGRLPIRGEITLQSDPFVRIIQAANLSVASPIPNIAPILSGVTLGMTVLQGFAKPAAQGRFDYKLTFEGGLPKINDRELPNLPFLPQL